MGAEHFGVRGGIGWTSAGLINFSPLALWKEIFDVPGREISLPALSVRYLDIRHSKVCEFMILEYVSLTGKDSSFYK